MDKTTFLNEMKSALDHKIPAGMVTEQINYYDNYIMEETKKGKNEEEVIEKLGSPQALAKTAISQNALKENVEYGDEVYYFGEEKGFHGSYRKAGGWDVRYGKFKLNSWYGNTILGIIVIVIIIIYQNFFR